MTACARKCRLTGGYETAKSGSPPTRGTTECPRLPCTWPRRS